MRALFVGFLLLCGGQAFAADPVACTEIGCVDGLVLNVAPDYHWAPGDYVFAFKIDGQPQTCRGSLPLKPCGEPSVICDGSGVMITESGCALPPDAHGFGTITLANGPAQVDVTITHNGQTLVQKTITPTYKTSRPNGPQCEPQCRQASVELFAAP